MKLDTPDRRMNAAKKIIQSYPDSFEEQVRDVGGLNKKEASIELFHYWMRNHTELSSGSVVDYRKYVAEFLDEDGELTVEREDLGSSHKQAAYSKYEEFQRFDAEDLEFSSTTSGDSE